MTDKARHSAKEVRDKAISAICKDHAKARAAAWDVYYGKEEAREKALAAAWDVCHKAIGAVLEAYENDLSLSERVAWY